MIGVMEKLDSIEIEINVKAGEDFVTFGIGFTGIEVTSNKYCSRRKFCLELLYM